jgi:hypothetical protein
MMNRRSALLTAGAAVGTALMGAPMGQRAAHGCELKGTPLEAMHLHLCAFHVAKDNRELQVEVHHYCMPLVENKVFQCIVTDSSKTGARILGVEYIVVDAIYQKFTKDEKELWHSHTYEVSSGLLVAPGKTVKEENELMVFVKNTWGKTYHTWPNPSADLPLGKPILMWAFDKDGQIDPKLVKKRDESMKIDTDAIRKRRAE